MAVHSGRDTRTPDLGSNSTFPAHEDSVSPPKLPLCAELHCRTAQTLVGGAVWMAVHPGHDNSYPRLRYCRACALKAVHSSNLRLFSMSYDSAADKLSRSSHEHVDIVT
jgi:hypothetical protein